MSREDMGRKTQVNAVADLLKQVLPPPSPHPATKTPMSTETESKKTTMQTVAPLSSTSTVVYETPKGRRSVRDDYEYDDDDDDDIAVEKDVEEYGREQFGIIAGSYLSPYVYGKKSLDTQYGIRKESDGRFMIGDSALTIATSGLKAVVLKGPGACGNY
jgi:hypothetical protein